MAESTSFLASLPPTPPPAVYAAFYSRSNSPQAPTPPPDMPSLSLPWRYTKPLRKIGTRTAPEQSQSPERQPSGPATVLHTESPANEFAEKSFTAQYKAEHPVDGQQRADSAPRAKSAHDLKSNRKDGRFADDAYESQDNAQPATGDLSRRRHMRTAPETSLLSSTSAHDPRAAMSRTASTSSAATESPASRPSEPLQYHHLEMEKLEDRMNNLNGINSRSKIQPMRPDSSGSESRRVSYGNVIQRPISAFSTGSDLRGRSPRLSHNNGARASSAHSKSPDMYGLSTMDLQNVSYPQQGPGVDNLLNASLRTAVGPDASLLSKRKTLEMYRASVKKAVDLDQQYHFAVYLIDAARDVNFEEEEEAEVALSDKETLPPIHDELLKEAKQILQKLADKSHPFAQYYLADSFASGLFNKGKEEWERAFPLFQAAAKHHHIEATYRTALCYEHGWGTRVDAAKAAQFYRKAASGRHPGAMLRLATAYLFGDMGLGRKYRDGIQWLKRSAESADAQYNSAPFELGVLHEKGFGDDVFEDPAYAAQLFAKSAELGHAEAGFRMGEAYEHRLLMCPRDPSLSVHYYTGAAQHGHASAMVGLSAWYLVGAPPILEKDLDEAFQWAKKAAELGMPKAQYMVGYFSEMGLGCRRDMLEANVWYVRAAERHDQRAIRRLEAIRAAATGVDPVVAAEVPSKNRAALSLSTKGGNVGPGKSYKTAESSDGND